ncbi:anthranilate phosphoribosyltransferase [Candidatus Micrarchaeota archaeon]|nr:anthranilate phosphoribosyltransferase [Candidatus Micrarchaeota archaeon]
MIKEAISKISEFRDLNNLEAETTFTELLEGKATNAQIASFLTALKMKSETTEEIFSALKVMKKHMHSINPKINDLLLDVCGTGGDKLNTFNISTTVMFVAAGAGCKIAKHGNRSVSSKCGSADVLEKLGISVSIQPETVEKIIEEIGIGFMFAPLHHNAMKNVYSARKETGIRSIFNILGPIANPSNAETRLLGAYNEKTAEKIAFVFKKIKVKRALVVYGQGGLDELSTLGKSLVFELNNKNLKQYSVKPENFGFRKAKAHELKGGNSTKNAEILIKILKGKTGPKRDIVLLNAGSAIYANCKADSIEEGIELAKKSIDSGKALEKLYQLKEACLK